MTEQNGKLRVAIVGCGMIYREHMMALRELADSVEVVAAVDKERSCLDVMRDTWGMPEASLYADWKSMLAAVKPDAVDVCLPNYEHLPAALDAIAAGCHVYMEKPLAMNVAECKTMLAAAKEKNVKLAVGFQQEYNPGTTILTNAREAGFFGDLRYVHGSLLRRRGTPNWGIYYSRELGGGPVLDIAVHLLDVITYVCGRPEPARVTASYFYGEGKTSDKVYCSSPNWNTRDYNVEDLAVAHITFANGLVVQLETSYVNHIKEDCVYDFKLGGSKGGAWWQSGKAPELYTDMLGAMMNITPAFLPSQGRPDMFRRKLENWVNACRTGSELLLPGEVGLYIQRILDAIALAARENKEVEVSC
ncbi:MAG: Gfo/Idh/MocA family oxidoreductase [Victivallaceae bacterium]|nr:Gfo/Idh/MocA family oxidoreductase [Victivallaceae bacterium]